MTKIGNTFEAQVRDLASDGRGVVSHPDGRTMFAAGVWLGERGVFRVSGIKGSVGFAELVELLEPSLSRREAPCPYFGFTENRCGGCAWQFVSYEAQLAAKQHRVDNAFARIWSGDVSKIWPSTTEWSYRNRAQLKTDGKELGFVAAKSNRLVAVEQCRVLSEKNQHTLSALQQLLPNDDWRSRKKNQWNTLDIDESVSSEGVSIHKRLPFAQANTSQNLRMRDWLQNKLSKIEKHYSVLELFCGSGNFTEIIAEQGFEKILAVEGVLEPLQKLEERGFDNVKTLQVDLFSAEAFRKIWKNLDKADILVLDPPRDGLKNKEGLLKKKYPIQEVFYISCDLATLVRDLVFFIESGFEIIEAQPLDQFPQTPHIEMCVHLKKR